MSIVTAIDCPGLPLFREGKVRSIFDFGDNLLMVTSDRVSAFDQVLPQGIPGKGALLTDLSKFWFDYLDVPNHLISTDVADFPDTTRPYHAMLAGRSMWVKKTQRIDIECIVRGYLAGSGWSDYQKTGSIKGHQLPDGLQLGSQLPTPIFTPSTKVDDGHDETISIDTMADMVGQDLTNTLMDLSLRLYQTAHDYAAQQGIVIADTKFEFGFLGDQIIIIDEVLTPDSSRFWPADYTLGQSPPSYDKQIIRDYLMSQNAQDQVPPPELPPHIIEQTVQQYKAIAKILKQGVHTH